MRGLPIFPLSISAADTGCTPAGVSQGEGVGRGVGVGVGVVPRVGTGVGVAVLSIDGVGVAVVPVWVAVGLGVGVLPPVLDVPPQLTTSKSVSIPTRSRPIKYL